MSNALGGCSGRRRQIVGGMLVGHEMHLAANPVITTVVQGLEAELVLC